MQKYQSVGAGLQLGNQPGAAQPAAAQPAAAQPAAAQPIAAQPIAAQPAAAQPIAAQPIAAQPAAIQPAAAQPAAAQPIAAQPAAAQPIAAQPAAAQPAMVHQVVNALTQPFKFGNQRTVPPQHGAKQLGQGQVDHNMDNVDHLQQGHRDQNVLNQGIADEQIAVNLPRRFGSNRDGVEVNDKTGALENNALQAKEKTTGFPGLPRIIRRSGAFNKDRGEQVNGNRNDEEVALQPPVQDKAGEENKDNGGKTWEPI